MKRCRYVLLCRGVLEPPRDPAPVLSISNGRISAHLQKVFMSSSKWVSVVSPSTCLGDCWGGGEVLEEKAHGDFRKRTQVL